MSRTGIRELLHGREPFRHGRPRITRRDEMHERAQNDNE